MAILDFKICANPSCGKDFLPRRWWQKYCCEECKHMVFYMRKMERMQKDPTSALDIPDGPSQHQLDEWQRRRDELDARMQEDRDWKAKLIAEKAEKLLKERDNPPPSPFDKYKPD